MVFFVLERTELLTLLGTLGRTSLHEGLAWRNGMRASLIAILFLPMLCDAACASPPTAQHAPFPRVSAIICALPGQEPVRAKGPAGNRQEPRRIPVPDGKKPEDLCPASAITGCLFDTRPGVVYDAPKFSCPSEHPP